MSKTKHDPFQQKAIREIAQGLEKFRGKSYAFEGEQLVEHTSSGRNILANFKALIIHDILQDDGAESKRFVEIEASLHGKTHLFKLAVSAFGAMNWHLDKLGPTAIIYQGHAGGLARTRNAIQQLSLEEGGGQIPQETVYSHTGWRKIDRAWFYLQGGEAIGECPNSRIHVDLPEGMRGFAFPDLSTSRIDRVEAIRASLSILDLLPDRIGFPVLAAVYRAVLKPSDFSVHLVGQSGVGKTEIAALAQQHFGPMMDARNLPGSWSSTDNALAAQLHQTKDALLVIDDFKPVGSQSQAAAMNAKADRVFRGQGNRSSRGRLSRTSELQSARPPMGSILSTGEDIPSGESLRGRLLVVEVDPGDVPLDYRLSKLQDQAASGFLAIALASFIKWFAPQHEFLQNRFGKSVDDLVGHFPRPHSRTPQNLAHLAAGFKLFIEFARECAVLNEAEATRLFGRCVETLQARGDAQREHLQDYDPALAFVEAVMEAVASKEAYLAHPNGREPHSPEACGYTRCGEGNFLAKGKQVGWINDEAASLLPSASLRVARLYRSDLPSDKVLGKRLADKGWLLGCDKGKNTARKLFEGRRQRVWHLRRDVWDGGGSQKRGPWGPWGPNGSRAPFSGDMGPVLEDLQGEFVPLKR